jgi:uncharacterized protein (TIGR02996 family)
MPAPRAARPEVLAFLQDMQDNPHDDAPRLILADWLEENGDAEDAPRAELLRVQSQAARLPSGDPRYPLLRAREQGLLHERGERWCADLGVRPARWHWERGLLRLFVAEDHLCQVPPGTGAGEAWAWVGELHVLAGPGQGVSLLRPWLAAGAALLAHVGALSLFDNRLGPADARALAGCPHLARLRKLVLDYNRVGDEGAAALAGSFRLPGLRELSLDSNEVGDTGAEALAHSTHRRGLTRLSLQSNPIGGRADDELRRRFGERVLLTRGADPQVPIPYPELSARARNLLRRAKVRTLGDLTRLTEMKFLSTGGFGETSLREIQGMMARRGLRLGQPPPPDGPGNGLPAARAPPIRTPTPDLPAGPPSWTKPFAPASPAFMGTPA